MMKKLALWMGTLGMVAALGACGGGSGGSGATPSPTPSAAGPCAGTRGQFDTGAGVTDPFKKGDLVCFTTVSSSTLAFNGKTLTGPTHNTGITAPYSGWEFVDGVYTYEVILNGSVPYEINVSKGSNYVGQFTFGS